MAKSQYEKDRIARVAATKKRLAEKKARKAKKAPPKMTERQKEMKRLEAEKKRGQAKKKKAPKRTLSSIAKGGTKKAPKAVKVKSLSDREEIERLRKKNEDKTRTNTLNRKKKAPARKVKK